MNIEKHDSDSDLVLDLYLPNILTGKYGDTDTPESVLKKIKEVDGAGSGLDADLLDGKHAGDFILKNRRLSGRLVVVAEDGEIADGGDFNDFKEVFLSKIPKK